MNLYFGLNQMMEYVEKHIEEEIPMSKLASFLGCSSYTMQRIFSMMTGFTIKEYIRKRRLSLAMIALQEGKKVIDVALMCGYTSATSFSRKFYDTYQIHPKDVKGKKLDLLFQPILKFDEKDYDDYICYRIEEHEEQKFYGKCIETDENIPPLAVCLWKEMKENYPSILEDLPRYAVIERRNEKDYYWVLSKKKYDSLDHFLLPKRKWLVFQGKSFQGNDIKKLWNKVNQEYLKSIPYKNSERYTLELYYNDYMEIWILLD